MLATAGDPATPQKRFPFLSANAGILILSGALLIVGACSVNEALLYSPDSANYLAWSHSIASLDGFKDSLGPDPVRYVVNAPLYPVLLFPVALLFPLQVVATKCFMLFLGLLMLVLFFRYAAGQTGTGIGLWAAAFLLINPLFVLFSTQILSEVPFAICIVLAFILAEGLTGPTPPPRMVMPAMVALMCAGIFLREIGFTLLISCVAFFALRGDFKRSLWLLLIPLLLYLLWFIRNEVIVAGVEQPELRNTRLLFSHFYTSDQASLVDEFFARISGNLAFYLPLAGSLVLFPEFAGGTYSVVCRSSPVITAVTDLLRLFSFPIALITIVSFLYGIRELSRNSRNARLLIGFTIVYAVAILLYPISDKRFLFPLLVPVLIACSAGFSLLLNRLNARWPSRRKPIAAGLICAMVFLGLPNLVWLENYIETSIDSRISPDRFYAGPGQQAGYPREFVKRFKEAGRWITDHTDSTAVVLSRFKEAALWSRGRKVVNVDPYIPLENFESMIRDYNVSYLVVYLEDHVLRDFEYQMSMSRRYRFTPRYRSADAEVLKVTRFGEPAPANEPARPEGGPVPQPLSTPREDSVHALFVGGLRFIAVGNYNRAVETFEQLRGSVNLDITGAFFSATAEEFAMNLDLASDLFTEFRKIPQGGSILRQAQYHLNFIAWLRSAAAEPDPSERAYLYHSVSLSYWQLGFRRQAADMLARALEADPHYFGGLVLGVVYGLQAGDSAAAWNYLDRARAVNPRHATVRDLGAILTSQDQLLRERDPARVDTLQMGIAEHFAALGLTDLAIDRLRAVLKRAPGNTDALRRISGLYTFKEHYAPALAALNLYCALRPDDEPARAERDRLAARR